LTFRIKFVNPGRRPAKNHRTLDDVQLIKARKPIKTTNRQNDVRQTVKIGKTLPKPSNSSTFQ
jgi:hypothetical protein